MVTRSPAVLAPAAAPPHAVAVLVAASAHHRHFKALAPQLKVSPLTSKSSKNAQRCHRHCRHHTAGAATTWRPASATSARASGASTWRSPCPATCCLRRGRQTVRQRRARRAAAQTAFAAPRASAHGRRRTGGTVRGSTAAAAAAAAQSSTDAGPWTCHSNADRCTGFLHGTMEPWSFRKICGENGSKPALVRLPAHCCQDCILGQQLIQPSKIARLLHIHMQKTSKDPAMSVLCSRCGCSAASATPPHPSAP